MNKKKLLEKMLAKTEFCPKDLLFFDRLIVPPVFTLVYWILLSLNILFSLVTLFSHFGFFSLVWAIVRILFGSLGVRVAMELVFVMFRINQNLEKMVALQQAQLTLDDDSEAESILEAVDAQAKETAAKAPLESVNPPFDATLTTEEPPCESDQDNQSEPS